MEYIEREAAEDAVGEAYLKGLNPLWELRDVPAADVVPVVHGRWDEDWRGIITCSECGRGFNFVARYAHYCAYCGAKMDGGAEDEVD